MKRPTQSLLQGMPYTKAADTDIRKTFERFKHDGTSVRNQRVPNPQVRPGSDSLVLRSGC